MDIAQYIALKVTKKYILCNVGGSLRLLPSAKANTRVMYRFKAHYKVYYKTLARAHTSDLFLKH